MRYVLVIMVGVFFGTLVLTMLLGMSFLEALVGAVFCTLAGVLITWLHR